ncbi:hypothetical protein LCGC14_2462790, partial [marine sediment metagenome]
LSIMLMPATALAQQEVCPPDGKVESQVPGDLDDIVLPDGTVVCIKASNELVTVTADGVKTLFELINNGHAVSHYTIISTPTTTTTTTDPDTTTTTMAPETTTTVPETTTTDPATTVPTTTPTELPDTGINASSWIVAALVLLMSGGLVLLGVTRRAEKI